LKAGDLVSCILPAYSELVRGHIYVLETVSSTGGTNFATIKGKPGYKYSLSRFAVVDNPTNIEKIVYGISLG
jgi:hypothetical protein